MTRKKANRHVGSDFEDFLRKEGDLESSTARAIKRVLTWQRRRMHNPAHPGEVLREYLPEGLAVTEAAKRLGVTRQALSALLNARADVSAEMALRLEGALGTSAEMWIEMQAGYDLWKARQRPKPKVVPLAA